MAAAPSASKVVKLSSGLYYEILKSSGGNKAPPGREVQVRYEGRLAESGTRFDKGTINFKLGAGEVIKGFDIGVEGMAIFNPGIFINIG